MTKKLDDQIAELLQVHKSLYNIESQERDTLLSGSLSFEASADGFNTISDSFEIELTIPGQYPDRLPRVKELAGKIDPTYDHINQDSTLCLAVPVEERRIFWEQPSLLGFVNRLVIPYFYGYSHFKKYGQHPFGEQQHGFDGIVQHYRDALSLGDEIKVLATLSFLIEYGYRGHHMCPCGSGEKVRRCHGRALRELHEHHTTRTLTHDFFLLLDSCLSKCKAENQLFPDDLERQVRRILQKMKQ